MLGDKLNKVLDKNRNIYKGKMTKQGMKNIGILFILSIFLMGIVVADNNVYSNTNYNNHTIYNVSNVTSNKFCIGTSCVNSWNSLTNSSFNQSLADSLYLKIVNEGNLNVNSSTYWVGLSSVLGIFGSAITNDLGWLTWSQIYPNFYFKNQTYNSSDVDTLLNGKLNLTDQRYNDTTLALAVNNTAKDKYNSTYAGYYFGARNETSDVFTNYNSTWDNRGQIALVAANLSSINTTGNIGVLYNLTASQIANLSAGQYQSVTNQTITSVNNSALHISDLPLANKTSVSCSNITGAVSNLCTITGAGGETDPIWSSNFTNMQTDCPTGNYSYGIYSNGTLKCRSDISGTSSGNYFDQQLNTTSNVKFNWLNLTTLLVGTYNISDWYANVSRNWTLDVYNNWNSTWDNSWVNQFAYNHTSSVYNLWNTAWSSTYNATYAGFANNVSLNYTQIVYNTYNSIWSNTYNSTYQSYANNVSRNWTLDTYNNWNTVWLATYNASYASFNTTLNIQNLFNVTLKMYAAPNTTVGIQSLINGTSLNLTSLVVTQNLSLQTNQSININSKRIYSNDTCIIIQGSTSTDYIC
jgi:hypothetical protein